MNTLSTALWVLVLVVSMSLAYSSHFSGATLAIGRALSDTGVGRGYQDAVTPPWEARLSLFIYMSTIAVIAITWYEFGTARGLTSILVFFVATLLWRRVLPKEDSTHYKKLIVVSMARRYADWVRSGDTVRASAMGELLLKMGLEMPAAPR